MWLDGGGVYVDANLRGGGEFGESWHQQGALTHKQNVFDDFIAAAEYLIARNTRTADHLAIMGGSNGGLLMGAALTQRPGVVSRRGISVGIYDMLRVELDPNGLFNTTEYGSVKDADQFKALYSYSPSAGWPTPAPTRSCTYLASGSSLPRPRSSASSGAPR